MGKIRSMSISSFGYLFSILELELFKQRQHCVSSDFYIGPVYKTNKSLVCMTRYHLIIGDTILEILVPLPDELVFVICGFMNYKYQIHRPQ